MAGLNKHNSTKKKSGSRVAVLVILTLIITVVAGYYIFSSPEKVTVAPHKPETRDVTPATPRSAPPVNTVVKPLENSPPSQKQQSNYPPATETTDTVHTGDTGSRPARLAIVIDDMGSSMSEARSLGQIKVPLTFAIIPGLRVDTAVAEYAAVNKIETMIHVPMQSKGWPAQRLETNGLLVTMDESELQQRMSAFVEKFPGAVGANNHMGSEFTEHEEKMTAMLQVLKSNNLFFIDSVTSSKSVAGKVAQQLGIKSARRNVFLDNEQNSSYIVGQLNQAVRLARKNGSAIAICHPHPATITTLAKALPELARQGITLVLVSQMVK